MSRLALFYSVFYLLVTFKSGESHVQSCFACAGPESDCVANNRTDFLKMDCNNFKVEGRSLIKRTSQPDLLQKFDDEVGPREDQLDVGCITLTFKHASDTPQERALKSCIPAQVFDEDVCTYMEGLLSEIGGVKTSCHFCKEDDCNSAISVPIGKPVTIVAFLVYFCKYIFLVDSVSW